MSTALHPEARQKLNAYKTDIARANGVESAAESFNVAPLPTQKMIDAYQKSADFLKKINIFQVDNQSGQKIGLRLGTTVASTTDTKVQPRRPTPVGELYPIDEYHCTQTNYDVAYYWDLINAWRHYPNFKGRLQSMVTKAVALDKLCMGWNGLYRAATSDRVANPLLQDVKKGWLQKIRDYAPEQCFAGDDEFEGQRAIVIGNEFRTLDYLIEKGLEEYIAEQHRESGLVAICGRGIMSDKYLPLLNVDYRYNPSESIAARTVYAHKELGTLQAMHVPHFPAKTILITTPDNLSIYMQNGTLVRSIQVQPEWDRDVDFQSVNEDYVVEDYSKCLLLENIVVPYLTSFISTVSNCVSSVKIMRLK